MLEPTNASWMESLVQYPGYSYSLIGLELQNLQILVEDRFYITQNLTLPDESIKKAIDRYVRSLGLNS